jgi:hypothetical protein
MDRFRLLSEFGKKAARESLDIGAVRLYLLLLAGCRESGRGKVPHTSLCSALGEELSPAGLRTAGRVLARHGLVEFFNLEAAASGGTDLDYRLPPHGGHGNGN